MTLKDFLKKLKKIEFHTRMKSQETIAGAYHSAFKGRGMSFSECKPYEDGDDVRYIDWHASARHQGLFVRQFVEERELSVYVVLDLSSSMHFGSISKTKAEAAIEAMSVIAFSALQNNDKVGMCLFNAANTKFIPQTKGKTNVVRFLIEALKFNALTGVGNNSLNESLVKTISVLKRRSLVFVISDFNELDKLISLSDASDDAKSEYLKGVDEMQTGIRGVCYMQILRLCGKMPPL